MRWWGRATALALLLVGLGFAYARFWRGPGPEALERQRREVRTLGERLERRLRERAHLRDAAGESLLIAVPAGVAERFLGQAVPGLAPGVRVSLRDLRFRKADEVQARLLLGRRSVGRFVLSVHVHEVHALLRPAPPRVTFGSDRIRVAQPVAVEDGAGRARLRFKWDGRGVAGAVCGDVDVTHEATATVPRLVRTLDGVLRLKVDGSALVAEPDFGDVELRLPIEPSAATWRFVDELVAGRSALCRAALGRADVAGRIRGALARGVRVTLPRRLLERPLRVPVVVDRTVEVPGRTLELVARPRDVILTPARLWYGVEVELRKPGDPPLVIERNPARGGGARRDPGRPS
jgi:hypothetical protein